MKERPKRIQRKRTKGWRMPDGAVCVTRPGIFGNPLSSAMAFRRWIETGEYHYFDLLVPRSSKDELNRRREVILKSLPELRGKDLCCWCKLEYPCHADVLLEIANK